MALDTSAILIYAISWLVYTLRIPLYLAVVAFIFWRISRAEWSESIRWRVWGLAACLLLGGPLLWWGYSQHKHSAEQRAKSAADQLYAERYAVTKARFDEHCKSAGIKIYRTAENVEGIFLMKIRGEEKLTEMNPQFRLNDPYGRLNDAEEENYVQSFLYAFDDKGHTVIDSMNRLDVDRGYHYVELINPRTGERTRYEMRIVTQKDWDNHHKHLWDSTPCGDPTPADIGSIGCPIPIAPPSPRYGVTFDDISTHEDRENWVAGSSLRVIDLKTGEVMAERIGYIMDSGLGIKTEIPPWLSYWPETTCPPSGDQYPTRNFVKQVLKPK